MATKALGCTVGRERQKFYNDKERSIALKRNKGKKLAGIICRLHFPHGGESRHARGSCPKWLVERLWIETADCLSGVEVVTSKP